jgi:hypothetical protein
LLERNADGINQCIRIYEPKKNLLVLKGVRPTLPETAYPSFEIDPVSVSNQWATTRAQRPRMSFRMMLTTTTSNLKFHVEYNASIATRIAEILTSPENLQLQVLNETKWNANQGLTDTYILDSLVENITYKSVMDGTIMVAEFDYFATIHEPYPEAKWQLSNPSNPTMIRPRLIIPYKLDKAHIL